MSLVSTSVPTLVNGVSQQAENLRFTSQCEEQVNGYSSLLRGLLKRPPTRHVAALPLDASALHAVPIDRSTEEQYMLTLGNGSLRVFTLGGVEVPVKNAAGNPIAPADLTYLQTTKPKESLRALTVADYTVLLNRERTVAMSSTLTPKGWPSALVFIRQFRQDANYTLRLYNNEAAWSTNTPSTEFSVTPSVATGNQATVATSIRTLLAASAAHAVYDHFAEGPLLFITKKDNSDFRIEVTCSIPEGASVLKDSVQNFSMLPKKGWHGFQLRVNGDPEDAGDDYFVKFTAQHEGTPNGFAEGSWQESQEFGLQDSFDASTMPHVLLNFGTYFQFKPLDWSPRLCGDAQTNSEPSFVGKQIRDVFFHKNRLGFLADENAVLSENGEFFNFWRTTVIQLLDSDPIDVAASHSKISILNSAVATSKKLVLFAEKTQFLLESGDTLTPKSVSTTSVSDYENIASVAPRPLNDSVLFPFKRGAFSGFYDYAPDAETDRFTGFDVTEHVPSYLAGTIESFDVSPVANLLVAKTVERSSTLFIYQFLKRGRDRLQSAWHRWEFSGAVESFFILGTVLYVIVRRGGSTALEKIELDVGVSDTDSPFTTLLDRRINESLVTATFDPVTETTSFVLPLSLTEGTARIIERATETHEGGAAVTVASHTGPTLVVSGDYTATPLWFGENYSMEMTLTRPQLREQRGDGSFTVVPGRFQVRKGYLTYNDSLAFSVSVTPKGRQTYVYNYAPRELGTLTALTGRPPEQSDGVLPFSVNSKSDQVTIKLINDTPLPCALLSIDWEALYTPRAQRT